MYPLLLSCKLSLICVKARQDRQKGAVFAKMSENVLFVRLYVADRVFLTSRIIIKFAPVGHLVSSPTLENSIRRGF